MKKVITCLALVGLCAGMALADKPAPRLAPPPQKAVPLTVQQVSPDFRPIGPVIPYADLNGGIAAVTWTVAFDSFEPTGLDGAPGEVYTPSCGMGGSRWWYGSQYRNPNEVNDMTLAAGTAGKMAEDFELCWTWYPPSAEGCYFFIFPTEDFDASCYGPPYNTGYDGIKVSYGTGLGNGNWYSAINLLDSGLSLQMPLDGAGGYHWVMARDQTTSAIILASMSYSMLWGTKDAGNPYFPGNNPSAQGPIQWDDDNPVDGSFDPTECYSYDWGTGNCPGVTGSMMIFQIAIKGVPCDANCDGYFDGADIDPFFLLLADPVVWQETYPDCNLLTAGDANFDGYADGADIDPFFAGLSAGECVPQ